MNVGFEWKVYAHDTPADLLDRLREFKFEIGPCEAVMIFDLSTAPAWISGPGNVAVQRIETLADVAIYQRVAEEAFGKNYSFTANELAEGLRNHSIEHQGYIAYYDDNPVSIARLYTHPQSEFAGLYGGATLPAWRGRGFYRRWLPLAQQMRWLAEQSICWLTRCPPVGPFLSEWVFNISPTPGLASGIPETMPSSCRTQEA